MKKIILLLLIIIVPFISASASKGIVIVDTPTAFTLAKGSYQVSLLGYNDGGMEFKTLIGLTDRLFLGVSFDVQNAIGYETPQPNIPGVIARIKFTDGWENMPLAIAVGYDSFYMGQDGRVENGQNELNRMIYGPYLVFSRSVYMFDSEQYVNFGIRMPIQPYYTPNDTSYFLSLDIPLGDSFKVMSEIERVYWNFHDSENWMINLGFRYSYLDQLTLELGIMFQYEKKPNRVLRIEYHGSF